MSSFNFARSQASAARMIARWGGPGKLIRGSAQRGCVCAIQDYKPSERGLYLDGSRRMFIAAKDLTVGPDHEQDQVAFKGKTYRIILPVLGMRPDDGLVMFYDCNVIVLTG